jgi:hypothetical protein
MVDDNVALCLSPQAFSNVNPATDIYNNTNQQVRRAVCREIIQQAARLPQRPTACLSAWRRSFCRFCWVN